METVVDVAELDDLGLRVVDVGVRPIDRMPSATSNRVVAIWAAGLTAIAALGLTGRFFEAPKADPPAPPVVVAAPYGVPRGDGRIFNPRAPTNTQVAMSIAHDRDRNGADVRVGVAGRIDGPVGNVEIKLVNVGDQSMVGVATRHFAPIDGRPPSPFGAFDVWFDVPPDRPAGDLWVTARAFVHGQVVGVASAPVETSWRIDGPNRFVIDDQLPGTSVSSVAPAGMRADPGPLSARVLGLGWTVDPYAR